MSGRTHRPKKKPVLGMWHPEDSVFPKNPIVCVPSVKCCDYWWVIGGAVSFAEIAACGAAVKEEAVTTTRRAPHRKVLSV